MNNVLDKVEKQIADFGDSGIEDSLFSMADFYIALKWINKNKYERDMGLCSYHIINGTNNLLEIIVKLFNSMLVHGMSPEDLNCGTMIPIPKRCRAKVDESDNF